MVEECIIVAKNFEKQNKFILFKNRDRAYKPTVKVVHEILNGVEVAYLVDTITGWTEGLNEFGIGIVNTALLVEYDEKEDKILDKKNVKSQDAPKVLKLLQTKKLSEAAKIAVEYKGGIKGHSFISDGKNIISIEMTRKHKAKTQLLKTKDLAVRTNHGEIYKDAGYTSGQDLKSSLTRKKDAITTAKNTDSWEVLARNIRKQKYVGRDVGLNMTRKTNKMNTTTQMLLNLTDKEMRLYAISGKVKFIGIENKLPKNYRSKITIKIFEVK